jgi:nicotinamide-nucleotide amidase
MGTAPGILIDNNGKILVSMPGVPFEMMHITDNHILPLLKSKYDGPPIMHLTVRTCGLGESSIADMIKEIEDNLPAGVKLAYLPDIAQVRLRFTVSGKPKQEMETILSNLKHKVETILGDYIYAYGDTSLEEVVGTLLIERNMKMVTCESCTGGYLAHRITQIPGCSANFYGSYVSYSNDYKIKTLHVQQSTLEMHGAVSEETVKEMVKGGIENSGVDVAVAISGIAGPDGASPGKPVGTVWIAVGNKERIITEKFLFTKDRQRNIEYSATYALILMRKFILERGI